MGLDMELVANRRLSPLEEGYIDDAVRDVVRKILGLQDAHHTTAVHRVIGYLRSALMIHNWFLSNARIGMDREGLDRYFLTYLQIAELHDTCVRVLEDPALAKALLPAYSGATQDAYDEQYLCHLQRAIALSAQALKLPETDWEFEYRFSS